MAIIKKLIYIILSTSGFIPDHMTWARAALMLPSVLVPVLILPAYAQVNYALAYVVSGIILYVGFIYLVLPENGLRLKLIQRFGEEKAYLYYEGFLAFAFFHNGVGLSYISKSSVGTGFWGDFPPVIVAGVTVVLFLIGMVIKLWSAYVVGIPIYYWKDMFLGRRISDFVVTGPYKYIANPMYGIGQLQVYAIAIYYNSIYGLIFGAVNQLLMFLFFYTVEKPFIYRTYRMTQKEPVRELS